MLELSIYMNLHEERWEDFLPAPGRLTCQMCKVLNGNSSGDGDGFMKIEHSNNQTPLDTTPANRSQLFLHHIVGSTEPRHAAPNILNNTAKKKERGGF